METERRRAALKSRLWRRGPIIPQRGKKEEKPAAGPKERNLQMQNHLWSTVKNLSPHEFYHLINVFGWFMMNVNVGVPRPACDGSCHCANKH